jgi:hypothetical protein
MGSGDRKGQFDLLADDIRWSWKGVTDWSRTFVGRTEVIEGLFGGVDKTAVPGGLLGHSDQRRTPIRASVREPLSGCFFGLVS